ncbi:hypothetical protein KFL_007940075 [Klebsormidium nitens]|uniref:Replication factor C large subunit n=1 Tax=Klebsormidium nitens TaxID=105231 RepID=A0A1Y1IKW4_KLENI|nr:hypothetical protein KFL_007940075 [Klebsormidium nitens]|eukprot:GAQ91490.1 hypothetical protein KFL_007940075 [Klebsormidium nitens]
MRAWLRDLESKREGVPSMLVLTGPTGSGKTAAAYELLEESGYVVMERNASDYRTKSALEDDLMLTFGSSWGSGFKQAVLVESIDAIAITNNNCGLDVLARIADHRWDGDADPKYAVRKCPIPIICTTSEEPGKGKLYDLVKKASMVRFPHLEAEVLEELAGRILHSENIAYQRQDVARLCLRAAGDARWLLCALELEYGHGRDVRNETLVAQGTDRRKMDEMQLTRTILYEMTTGPGEIARMVRAGACQESYAITSLVQENYPFACRDDIGVAARAADATSEMDMFDDYIHREQDWGFLDHMLHLGPLRVGYALAESRETPVRSRKRTIREVEETPDEGPKSNAFGKRKRSKRGIKRRTEEGSINMSCAWSKLSYAASRAKKLSEVRGSMRLACRELACVDGEWLYYFTQMITTEMKQTGKEDNGVTVLSKYAMMYNLSAKTLDDALKMVGNGGLSRAVIRGLARRLAPERYSPELFSGEEFEDDYSDDSGSDAESTATTETPKDDSDDDPDYVEGMETEEVISDAGDEEEDSDAASETDGDEDT